MPRLSKPTYNLSPATLSADFQTCASAVSLYRANDYYAGLIGKGTQGLNTCAINDNYFIINDANIIVKTGSVAVPAPFQPGLVPLL